MLLQKIFQQKIIRQAKFYGRQLSPHMPWLLSAYIDYVD